MKVLTQEQIKEIKSEMVDAKQTKPCRFMKNGGALNISTGEITKGNVIHHTVYWNFTRETAKKVAAWTESRVEFSE